MTTNEVFSRAQFAEQCLFCSFSNVGCNRLPIRMIVETTPNDPESEAQIVMLCLEHTTEYTPTGTVIVDQMLPTHELLDAETLLANPSTESMREAEQIMKEGGPEALIAHYEKKRL